MNTERVKTGIPGLDELMGGGIPRGHTVIIGGGPGSGKTVMSSQIIHEGVNYGDKGVYVTFSETPEAFKRNMKIFGWDFNRLERMGMVKIIGMPSTVGGAAEILGHILDEVRDFGAQRLVIDSFTALTLSLGDTIENVRALAYTLYQAMKRSGCALSILVAETPYGEERIGMGVEEFIADGIILLNMRVEGRRIHRSILVLKMRGTEHDLSYHPLIIDSRGVRVLPEIE